MEHFYPSESSPKSELGYQALTVEEMFSLFIVFIAMAIFALLSLFAELMIKKVHARNSETVPPQVEATAEGSSGGTLENMMCQVEFNVKVGDTVQGGASVLAYLPRPESELIAAGSVSVGERSS